MSTTTRGVYPEPVYLRPAGCSSPYRNLAAIVIADAVNLARFRRRTQPGVQAHTWLVEPGSNLWFFAEAIGRTADDIRQKYLKLARRGRREVKRRRTIKGEGRGGGGEL